jgi:hypothetical protein
MDAESFTDLALRVSAGEATPDERAAVERAMAADPARRGEFEQIALALDALRAASPMTEAARATSPGLPAHRVQELHTAVRQNFGPAATREKRRTPVLNAFRWLFAGGGLVGLAAIIVLLCFSNRTVAVGLYGSDLAAVRGDQGFSPQDFPAATIVAFDRDAAFDAWQNQPLAWYEHARIWVDNEHDQLHILRRIGHGNVVSETQPLAPTNEAERAQIQQAIQSLSR